MSACTFFGHKDAADSILPPLWKAVEQLIVSGKADTFYVGNQGNFDRLVLRVLRELSYIYGHIRYSVVLAYHPTVRAIDGFSPEETVFPERLDGVYPKFAISKRNELMLKMSEYVIAYAVKYGGAQKFAEKAEKMHKSVIYIK